MDNITPNNKKKVSELIWYAAYGSNILMERFMCYIEGGTFSVNGKTYYGCADHSAPFASMPVTIPYSVYYGNSSPSWDGCGVAFLDTTKQGSTQGRMYLISRNQFLDVWHQEGNSENWYDSAVNLGEYNGIPVYTFTNSGHRYENEPSEKYLEVVRRGIEEMNNNTFVAPVIVAEEPCKRKRSRK